MLRLRWPAARAGVATLAVAVVGALVWPALSSQGLPEALWGGVATSGKVLYVLFGGLLLYNVLAAAGAVEKVSRFLGQLEPEQDALAMLVVVGVAPFFESVTGFGVGVVISAPILLAAGFTPLRAATLASWGQCAVPWGALGVGTVIGADLAGLTFKQLSDVSAWMNLPLFPVYALAALGLAGGWSGIRRRGTEAVYLGLVAGVVTLLTSLYLVPELSGAAGGLAVSAVFLTIRLKRLREVRIPVRELAPYGILLGLLAAANGWGPARTMFANLGPIFAGPGPWLLTSSAFAALLFGPGNESARGTLQRTLRQWASAAGAVVTFVLAGQVVASSGAAAMLAGGAAGALGTLYPALSPLTGALGGAITGSNAASNALFMPFQVEAAHTLAVSEPVLAGIQNVAGSHASLLAPQRIVLAATATGLLNRESEIIRAVLPPVAVSLLILAAIGAISA